MTSSIVERPAEQTNIFGIYALPFKNPFKIYYALFLGDAGTFGSSI